MQALQKTTHSARGKRMAQKKEESKGGFSTVADRVLGYEEDVRAQLD